VSEDPAQKPLLNGVAELPAIIQSVLSNPKTSPSGRLQWLKLAIRIFRGPSGRTATDGDAANKHKAAEILEAAVPALEKIRDEHPSAGLRSTAAQHLLFIAHEIGTAGEPSAGADRTGT
jgi:hypothetical protein